MPAGTVLAPVVAAMLLDPRSQVFLLKAIAVVILAGLPGWLYLEFVRSKGHSLYDEYVINLFRLRIDQVANLPAPPQHTSWHQLWKDHRPKLATTTKDNLYRRKFEAVFGEQAVSTRALLLNGDAESGTRPPSPNGPTDARGHRRRSRSRNETFRPVLLASLLLTIGWTVAINPEVYRTLSLTTLPFSGRPQLPAEALRFGFVGAYWFILQDVIRRYFRDDLKTAAYVSASARIILVVIVVTMVSLGSTGASTQLNVLAFFIGIFPQIGVQILKAGVNKAFKGVVPSLDNKYPLSDLDGLTIWDQARLFEEGIEDLHGLVTANLVDVILRTRIPVDRLVDWLDQALLYLHVPAESDEHNPRQAMRALGIRTATDLERAWVTIDKDAAAVKQHLTEAIAGAAGQGVAVVQTVLASLAATSSFLHVQRFKRHDWLADQPPARAA